MTNQEPKDMFDEVDPGSGFASSPRPPLDSNKNDQEGISKKGTEADKSASFSPIVEEPQPQDLDDLLNEADNKVKSREIDNQTTTKELFKDDDIFKNEIDQLDTTTQSPTILPDETSIAPPPKKRGSILMKIIIILVVVLVIIGGSALAYFLFFNDIKLAIPFLTTTEEATTTPVGTEAENIDTTTEEEGKIIINTDDWLLYTNDNLGISFNYPKDYSIISDLSATTTPTDLLPTNIEPHLLFKKTGSEELLAFWAQPQGMAEFISYRGAAEINPSMASVYYTLKRDGEGLTINLTSYNATSGVIGGIPEAITAHTVDKIGNMRFVFLFMNDQTDNEEVFKTLLSTVRLKLDSDNDGLFDDKEADYGTDPNNPDSDGDSFIDGDEIINGYNPLGEGKL